MSRHPKIGDIIKVGTNSSDETNIHIGLVRQIILDAWGHQQNVYVEWSTDPPTMGIPVVGYNPKHGYAGVNIHNCRDFEIIRAGKFIV